MLHLLNGDATAAVFPATLPGDRAVWRDIMVEGPAVDDGAVRARWLAPRLGIAVEDYERTWRDGRAMLAGAAASDEIVLWFEQDLFCAVNLWFVLHRLPSTAVVSLVFPPVSDAFRGLGTLQPDHFPPLFADRRRLDDDARADAVALWGAYADTDPTALMRLAPRLPFGREAARLHLGRFPSTTRGLDEVELTTLRELASASRSFADLFAAVTRTPEHLRHGLGDVQYASALRDLVPLVTIADAGAEFTQWRISLSATGAEALGGRLDGLACRALARWLGGVHVRPGAPAWRWDGTRLIRQ